MHAERVTAYIVCVGSTYKDPVKKCCVMYVLECMCTLTRNLFELFEINQLYRLSKKCRETRQGDS